MFRRVLVLLPVLALAASLSPGQCFGMPDTLWTRTYYGGADDGAYSVYQTSDGGFITTGAISSSDLKRLVSSGGDADVWLVKTNATGDTLWKKTFGGSDFDRGNSVQQTADGGYIIAGQTYSFGAGNSDVWLIKTDANGDTLWTKAYGGSGWDGGYSVRQTSDGGYVIAGWEDSFDGGGADVWLLRTDANGDTSWARSFGTSQGDWGRSVQETIDSGFVVVGNTWGIVGSQSHVYLIKTDSLGNQDWAKTYAGGGISYGSSIQVAPDSGYIISGVTTVGSAGGKDVYLLKTDSLGNYDWSKTYGGTDDDGSDGFSSVQLTSDGGYVVAGWTKSFGAGGSDLWLLKTDASGDTAWTTILGGSGDDEGWSVVQDTSDNGYLVAGFTNSSDYDFFLVKADASGDTLWTRTYCGGADDGAYSVYQTSDGGFVMTGAISSCDLKQLVSLGGDADVWLVKTDANGDTLWKKTFGGSDFDRGNSVQQTADGGYIIAGQTYSFGAGNSDVWLIKTDANGDTLWTKAYGGSGWDGGYSVRQTSDGGYIIAGWEDSFDGGGADVWVIRTDANGDTSWARSFGTSQGDWGRSVQETIDSGFVVVGNTWGIVGGESHVYLIKTDSLGNQDWAKTHAGGGISYGSSIQVAPDSGYIISGVTTVGSAGGKDVYLLKTDSLGNYDWSKTYGGTEDDGSDGFSSVQLTSDGGYVVAGWTKSFGAGGSDLWLLKTDANGDTAWTTILGGSGDDEGWSVVQDTSDNGYAVAGFTNSFGAGDFDFWLLKLEAPTAVEDEADYSRPEAFRLRQNYPNPFNSATTIRYLLPRPAKVTLSIYNLLGQKVETLLSGKQRAGEHTVQWDATGLSSGVYFYRLEVNGFSEAKRLVLLK